MTQDEIIRMAREAGCEYKTADNDYLLDLKTLERFAALVAAHEREKQAEQEPVAWMWACTECGTEAEDGTDGRICSSCGYHKFYKAPKVATCVCAAKTQENVKQEPVAEALQIASVALQDIACSAQTENLYWWQLRARKAQKQIAERLTNAAPQPTQKVSESVTEQEPVLCVECGKPTMHMGNKCYACCQKDTKDLEDALKSWDAAPVRTEDLTELLDVMVGMANYIDKLGGVSKSFRAAIAADREKNK